MGGSAIRILSTVKQYFNCVPREKAAARGGQRVHGFISWFRTQTIPTQLATQLTSMMTLRPGWGVEGAPGAGHRRRGSVGACCAGGPRSRWWHVRKGRGAAILRRRIPDFSEHCLPLRSDRGRTAPAPPRRPTAICACWAPIEAASVRNGVEPERRLPTPQTTWATQLSSSSNWAGSVVFARWMGPTLPRSPGLLGSAGRRQLCPDLRRC